MPSFYPRPMPRDLPPTPPEFMPGYNMNGCAGNPYSQGMCAGYPGMGMPEPAGYDRSDRFAPPMPAAMYPTASYANGPFASAPFFGPAPMRMLPPMRTHDQSMRSGPSRTEPPKEEKSVGGVSATLDYTLDTMTDFVAETARGLLAAPTVPPVADFRKWVHSVLSATRLPSATIMQSLHYLSVRLRLLAQAGQGRHAPEQIYITLTIALTLGSKFLDDNTFINRSWSDVSGIDVAELNRVELDWLTSMEFNLHRDPSEAEGFQAWLTRWKEFEVAAARAARPDKLAPIDTSMIRQHSGPAPSKFSPPPSHSFGKPTVPEFAPKSALPQYTPAYSFDPWGVTRSATDRSPCSAPHTGPTTPEYFGAAGIWGPPEGYSRRTMFGFPSAPAANQPPVYGAAPFTPHYTPNVWTGHPMGCSCFQCGRQHASAYFAPGYGAQPVVG